MAVAEVGRAVIFNFILLFTSIQVICAQNQVPNVYVQALKPKGFRASIDDVPNLTMFVFQGNVNKPIKGDDVGRIRGEVLEPINGRWVVEDLDLQLKIGDVINYYVFVSIEMTGYKKENQVFTVTELEDPKDPPKRQHPASCNPTLTVVRGGTACSGQTIFEDSFDSLREDVWQIEQYIPVYDFENPFVSYQRLTSEPTVIAADGLLRITPKLQQKMPGFNNESIYCGSLNLFASCTAAAEACVKEASGADILPPVVSGRITSKGFAFTYGTVHVRAKLPQGDWLYPEILLAPFMKKYGSLRYASGVLKIAAARGNKELYIGPSEYGNKLLYGGPIMDSQCRELLLMSKLLTGGKLWGDDYHVYSMRWAPDRITFSVDGEEWARVEPSASGLAGRFPVHCSQLPRSLLAMGSRIAPFDDYFYLTLGVAAGGVTEFHNGVYTESGRPKPWSNEGRKALLNFWRDMDPWLPTWTQPELLVDYVKVVAL